MRRTLILLVAIIFVVALLSLTVTYTVRFTETAVLTTFGSADESDVITEPGLKFKWPEPIQAVTKYDRRARFLETRLETQQTADSSLVTVESFATWRVADPLEFFKRFSHAGDNASDHYLKAESEVLRPALRTALSETSRFAMDELFTADASGSKLPELEGRILAAMKASLADAGVEVVDVGISRIVLPEKTSSSVFERMRAERNALVNSLQATGDAEAQKITSQAEANADKIESFAQARAAQIRALGEHEATEFVKAMNEQPDLAIFLRQIDFMKQAMGSRVTMFFQTNMPGFELFGLDAGAKAGAGTVPGLAERTPQELRDAITRQEAEAGPGTPVSAATPGTGRTAGEGDR